MVDCRRHGCEGFALTGRIEGDVRVDLETQWEGGVGSRRVNGKTVTGRKYLEALPVVSWSSGDRQLLEGGPEQRRRFLDQGIVGLKPSRMEALSRYRRALGQKRELLRRGGRGLGAWNEVLAPAARELIALRKAYVERLSASLERLVVASALILPRIRLSYRPSPGKGDQSDEQLLREFEAVRQREISEERPLVGPHRDHLMVLWGDFDLVRVASAGEKKLFGLLLSAARGEVLEAAGRRPIFLLDDIDAELDSERLGRLWTLFENRRQVLATTTGEPGSAGISGGTFWRIRKGSVAEV
jgi:DNA replication and repair protein RecF